jgi:subtilisin family serine protease
MFGAPTIREERTLLCVVSGVIVRGQPLLHGALVFFLTRFLLSKPPEQSVIDSGVFADHQDLNRDQLTGYNGSDFELPWWEDGYGHGTHVTGTIAASDNGHGVVGVAPEADIFVVRVFDDWGEATASDLIVALEACRDAGADIVSMSLGGFGYSENEQSVFSSFYKEENIVSIAAAGNSGMNEFYFPASYTEVIGVAAVDQFGHVADFSTRNEMVDLAAPGVGVLSTYVIDDFWHGDYQGDGLYAYLSGTSMACPHVAGVAALLLSYNHSLSPADVFDILTSTATMRGPEIPGPDIRYGHGIVDALAALNVLSGVEEEEEVQPSVLNFEGRLWTGGWDSFETSHKLIDEDTGETLFWEYSLDPYSYYSQVWSLDPNGCYLYYILDWWGDGSEPGYGFEVLVNGEILLSGDMIIGYGGYIEIGRPNCTCADTVCATF